MKNKNISFVFCNKIYYICLEDTILTVTQDSGEIIFCAAINDLNLIDPLQQLVAKICQTLF